MYGLFALVSLVVAAVSFYFFQQNGNTLLLVVGIGGAVLTAVFGVVFLSSRLNKTDDIHITE